MTSESSSSPRRRGSIRALHSAAGPCYVAYSQSLASPHPRTMSISLPPAPATTAEDLAERARAAAELLEAIVDDRALLARLSPDERTRLLQAAGLVSRPDAVARRQLVKAA